MSDQPAQLRRRFWLEAALASVTGLLFFMTMFWHDWLEALGFRPDHGNGSAEWLFFAGCLVVCVGSSAMARVEWRKAAPGPA